MHTFSTHAYSLLSSAGFYFYFLVFSKIWKKTFALLIRHHVLRKAMVFENIIEASASNIQCFFRAYCFATETRLKSISTYTMKKSYTIPTSETPTRRSVSIHLHLCFCMRSIFKFLSSSAFQSPKFWHMIYPSLKFLYSIFSSNESCVIEAKYCQS